MHCPGAFLGSYSTESAPGCRNTTTKHKITMDQSQYKVEFLKLRLAELRESSVMATRRGDYREVARLTTEAARINNELSQTTVLTS